MDKNIKRKVGILVALATVGGVGIYLLLESSQCGPECSAPGPDIQREIRERPRPPAICSLPIIRQTVPRCN